MEIFVLEPLVVGKLSLFSGMYDDALMHREGLTLSSLTLPLSFSSITSRELLSQVPTNSG